MTTAGWIALAITVSGALSYAAASILQAVAARRSTGTVRTMGHPLYLAGIGCDVFAWVGSMVALQQLAVYLVESVLAGSLAITVVAARFVLRSRLRRRDVAAVVVSIAALVLLAMSAGPQHDLVTTTTLRVSLCAAAAVAVVVAWGAAKVAPAGVVAAVAGLCLGGAALVGRALPGLPTHHWTATALAVVTEPLFAALLVFAATGMTMYAHALQHGQVGPVTAVHWSAEVIAPSAIALLLLGDTVRSGWELPAAAAGLITVGAAVILANAPANRAIAHPTDAGPAALQPIRIPRTERVIWWGPPPIWIPPERSRAIAAPAPVPQLTHAAPVSWSEALSADDGPAEAPVAPPPPARAAERMPSRIPEPVPATPWFDL
jgi:drug/metabolite transporter (DMT)-like permease